MQILLKTFLVSTMLAGSAVAANLPDFDNMSHDERRAAIEKMSPEQRKSFEEARKAKWEALSAEEKVNLIEEKRAKHKAQKEAEWNNMSAEEKIKHAEERMKDRKEGHKGPKGKKPQ